MKKELLQLVIAQLEEERNFLEASAKASFHAATDEENRPENQYDTRALEASYLAAAQNKRLQEVGKMIHVLRNFPLRASEGKVVSGSLLTLESEGEKFHYFLLPFGAGISLDKGGVRTTVVTVDSPLGTQLMGKKMGELVELKRAGGSREFEVLAIV